MNTIGRDYTSGSTKGTSTSRKPASSKSTVPETSKTTPATQSEAVIADLSTADQEKSEKESEEEYYDRLLKNYKEQLNSIKRSFHRKQKVSYDALADLNALAGAETIVQVKRLKSRLTLKASLIAKSGAASEEVRAALVKIKKVLKKASVKIRRLMKEAEIDQKRKQAERSLDKKLEKKLERILTARRRNRRAAERNDIIDAVKGQGANLVTKQEIEQFPALIAAEPIYEEPELSADMVCETEPVGSIEAVSSIDAVSAGGEFSGFV